MFENKPAFPENNNPTIENKVEYPFPEICSISAISQDVVDQAIRAEVLRNPEFLKAVGHPSTWHQDEWDDITSARKLDTGVYAQLEVVNQMQEILDQYPDSEAVKEKIFLYLSNLGSEELKVAIKFIKLKIEIVIDDLKQRIIDGRFVPGQDNYYHFLATMRTEITKKYPLNMELLKYLFDSLFKLYNELETSKTLPGDQLYALHKQIELFVSGSQFLFSLPKRLDEKLQKLLNEDENKNIKAIAKPLSKQGDHSFIAYSMIPSPESFEDIEPYKSKALDVLEEMREKIYDFLKRLTSFTMYFETISELEFAKLEGENIETRENIFCSICNSEKNKFDSLFEKLNELQVQLNEILTEMGQRDRTIDRKSLPIYINSVDKHLQAIWDEAVVPHLIYFANLIFGETPENKAKWF